MATTYFGKSVNGVPFDSDGNVVMGGGGSGSPLITVTKAAADALIAANGLVSGQNYLITGVDVGLYGGTDIILKAASTKLFERKGSGFFYNPKYTSNLGWGIWTKYMESATHFSAITGTFNYLGREGVTAQNGATGILLADGFIEWVSGDWSAATSITGNTSAATATVTGFTSPSYAIGANVIWGGKHWVNVAGNVGAETDILNLNNEWQVVPFDATNYNLVSDVIEYYYINDLIVMRHEVDGGNIVTCTKADAEQWIGQFNFHPISVFMWGNIYDYNSDQGVGDNKVFNSYCENINFIGSSFYSNTLGNSSIYSNTLNNGSSFSSNTLNNGSSFYLNTLISSSFYLNTLNGSIIYSNTLNDGSISSNTLNGGSSINSNTLSGGSISSNTLSGGIISSNTLSDSSSIYSNTLSGGSIYSNTLSGGSNIYSNTLNGGSISSNTLSGGSNIVSNILSGSGGISSNTLSDSSNIVSNILSGSGGISSNTLSDSSSIYSNTLSGGSIYSNTLSGGSNIYSNTLNGGSIYSNTLSGGSNIYSNTLNGGNCEIGNNNILTGSQIFANEIFGGNLGRSGIVLTTLSAVSYIHQNRLKGGYFNFGLTLPSNRVIALVEMATGVDNRETEIDVSSATFLFQVNLTKNIFTRQDGTPRLSYYDNTDTLKIVDVNA